MAGLLKEAGLSEGRVAASSTASVHIVVDDDGTTGRIQVEFGDIRDPALRSIHVLAARLGWEIVDPQANWHFGSAGTLPPELRFDLPAVARRKKWWVAQTDMPGSVRSLSMADDGTCAIGYAPPRDAPNGEFEVQLRSGADLNTVMLRCPGVRDPALSRDGEWLAAEQVWPHGIVQVMAVSEDWPSREWPLMRLFAWRPSSDSHRPELVSLTRHPFNQERIPDGPDVPAEARDQLLALEGEADPSLVAASLPNEGTRVVVAEVRGERVSALAKDRRLHDMVYVGAQLAVSGDGETAVACAGSRAMGFSLTTGEVRWVTPPSSKANWDFHTHWRAAAASPCGRLTAVCGGEFSSETLGLVLIDAVTGRLLLALNNTALGSSATPSALCFHPSGWLAVGFTDGKVTHLTPSGSATSPYRALSGAVHGMAFSPDGSTLLVGGSDKRGIRAVELSPTERQPV
ncbi:WD40 repeat domain-containing protein [Streptomyces sp. 3N207]|uniref:WD40 repeat domain-containing protein n=1 Tax=Streptomyces sp. 3N207 TaxID=3457417 RepID=UPI003FD4F820